MHDARWSPDDYGPALTGEPARKLSDSAVAPLVALAGGLFTITDATAGDYPVAPRRDMAAFRHLKESLSPAALAMPWFEVSAVGAANAARATHAEVEPAISCAQWRPDTPFEGKRGSAKYLMPKGGTTVIGVHPATPASYLGDPTQVIVAEGLLKAYSLLSAWLDDQGVSDKHLRFNGDPATARRTLRTILDELDTGNRLLILTIVGVGNWRGRPEWDAVRLSGRPVAVAFDADLSTNHLVWSQADHLARFLEARHAEVSFLDPSVDGAAKAGLDDFFAAGRTFTDLMDTAFSELPDPPSTPPAAGEVRVDEATASVQRFTDDGNGSGHWTTLHPLAGRITRMDTSKAALWDASDTEMATGKLDPAIASDSPDDEVEIEVSWIHGPTGQLRKAVITGPTVLLTEPPDRWFRYTQLPKALTRSPVWPPPAKDWMQAIKAHRESETIERGVWRHMGWVPTESGVPVFICGNDIVGADGYEPEAATPGANDVVPNAGRFGLNVIEGSGKSWDKSVRALIERVLGTYTNGAWKLPGVDGLVLAAALRPVVPLRCRSTVLLYGPPRAGKSWTASAIMSFWQKHPGGFWAALPGSASDTKFAMEKLIARAPIWVADDLAPTVDAARAAREEASLGAIVRSVFNGSTTARGQADGKLRETEVPRSLLVVTAENAFSAHSEMERVVNVMFAAGSLSDSMVEVEALGRSTNDASELTTAAVQFVARLAREQGWASVRSEFDEIRRDAVAAAASEIKHLGMRGDGSRHSEMSGELTVALCLLSMLAESVGCSSKTLSVIDDLQRRLVLVVTDAYRQQSKATPGAALLDALKAVMSAGQGHIRGEAGAPPVTGGPEFAGFPTNDANELLGWELPADPSASPRGRGTAIGKMVVNRSGEPHVVFDQVEAFRLAQQMHSGLIPHGQKSTASWSSMWAEQIADGWTRRAGNGTQVTARCGGGVTGVPVPLGTVLGDMSDPD